MNPLLRGELAVPRLRAFSETPEAARLDVEAIRVRILVNRRVLEHLERIASGYREEASALEAMLAELEP